MQLQEKVAPARAEGIVPAPEPTHALAAAIREAIACRESGAEKVAAATARVPVLS